MGNSNLKKTLAHLVRELRLSIVLERHPEETISLQNDNRDETFDALKGTAIILMIIGHCEIGQPFGSFINSFHMPLFFFATGYFLKKRPFCEDFNLSVRRLIIPYTFTAFIICIVVAFKDLLNYTWADGSYTQGTILHFLLGYRGDYSLEWFGGNVGILWFLLAMFWARCLTVFFINKVKSKLIVCLLLFFCGIFGIFLQKYYLVPYCIPQGLSAALFVYIGFLIKEKNLLNFKFLQRTFFFLFLLWFYSFSHGGVSMYNCKYPAGYIAGLWGALGMFLFLHMILRNLFCKDSLFWRIIHFSGRYSLVILCAHSIEFDLFNWKSFALMHRIPLEYFNVFQVSMRFAVVFVFCLIILRVKILRKEVFQIKTG